MQCKDDKETIDDPSTKQEWNRFRGQFENTAAMNYKFYQDPMLPVRLRMLVLGGRWLHYDYAEMGRMMDTEAGRTKFAAERANCSFWSQTVAPMLASKHDAMVWHKLGLKGKQATPIHPDCQAPWYLLECEIVEQYCSFISEMSGEFLWGQLPFWLTFPLNMAALKLSNFAQVQNACLHMERIAKACKHAEEHVLANPVVSKGFETTILKHAYYLDQQLARRSMSAGFQANWDPRSMELQAYGRLTSGGPSTTADLAERAFAHLLAVSKLHAKAKYFSFLSKWFYNNTNPYTHGLNMLKTSMRDWEDTSGHFHKLANEVISKSSNMAKTWTQLVSKYLILQKTERLG
jgi:hypothetical protein